MTIINILYISDMETQMFIDNSMSPNNLVMFDTIHEGKKYRSSRPRHFTGDITPERAALMKKEFEAAVLNSIVSGKVDDKITVYDLQEETSNNSKNPQHMDKVKVTIEDLATGKKIINTITISDTDGGENVAVKVQFVPDVRPEEKGAYIGLQNIFIRAIQAYGNE